LDTLRLWQTSVSTGV